MSKTGYLDDASDFWVMLSVFRFKCGSGVQAKPMSMVVASIEPKEKQGDQWTVYHNYTFSPRFE